MNQPTCRALTKQGASCRAPALPGRETCLSHTPELAEKVAAARARGGTMAAKVRVLEGKRQRLDTPRKLLAFVSDLALGTLSGSVEPDVSRATAYAVSLQMKLLETAEIVRRLEQLEERLAQQQSLRAAGWGR